MSDRVLFLDVEASGLGPTSFPIEVGWAWLDGGSGALLVRPALDWDLHSWDESAAQLHGIPLDQLQSRRRAAAREVAEHLNAMVLSAGEPVRVILDAPRVRSVLARPAVPETPAQQGFRLIARERFGALDGPGSTEMTNMPLRHRAEADALRLRARWFRLIEAQRVSSGGNGAS